ncbi:MAG: Na+/H+ antiporter subunit E [Oscillospiraceae bacterium]|nr:Na+/H+ antiporter subunit E [Oscillospiraceae bacterium]
MKKAKFPAILSTAIVCYIFWLVITGQIAAIFTCDASWQVLAAGGVVSILTALFTARFFIHKKAFYLFNPKRFFAGLYYCLFAFPWELLKANIDVAFRALSPKKRINPGIVKIKTDLESEYALSALANSITLTPGTITLDIVEENGENYYYIHWINATTEDVGEASDAIAGTLEKWVRRIWGK